MAKRKAKNRSLGFSPEIHKQRASENAGYVMRQVETANAALQRGQCRQALALLVGAAETLGIVREDVAAIGDEVATRAVNTLGEKVDQTSQFISDRCFKK